MNIQNPIVLQLLLDLALLVTVIFVFWRINANLKKPLLKSHQELMQELKAIMAESQASSENFLHAMEQSRLALKEIALELDIKEQRVKSLLAKTDNLADETGPKRTVSAPADKYDQVLQMIKKGCSEAQAAQTCNFTEAEVGLIVDLYRVKNENA